MSKTVVVLNNKGFQELLKSPEMQSVIKGVANQKMSALGDGYETDVHVFQKRAVAHIYPTTYEAKRDNYENNTLIKVVL